MFQGSTFILFVARDEKSREKQSQDNLVLLSTLYLFLLVPARSGLLLVGIYGIK